MNTQLDKVLNELKNLSSEVYPNIELPTDTVLASYEPYRVCRRLFYLS